MGHASYTMTAHYTHSDIKSLTAITDALSIEKNEGVKTATVTAIE